MSLAIGVDIGGTKVAAGVVDDEGRVLDSTRRPTPGNDVAQTEAVIAEVVAELSSRHEVTAVGIGAAGWIANDHATVLFSPHLAWRNEPLRDALAEVIGVPVVVENDANAAAWAEYRYGAARDSRVSVMVTMGTGIGGGLVFSGILYRGANGVGCEYGHMSVVPDGRRCACGNRGCWEMYASGTALARDARELAAIAPVSAHRLMTLANGDVDQLTGQLVTQAAREGDPAAVEIYTQMGRWLGRGLANLAAVIDPTVFVIGGGVSEAGDLLLGPARQSFAESLTGRGFRPAADIRLAELGPEAGLVGAADLARRRH
ncbi:ROK family glucokinase [Jatrophihabitans lederbergiae]|jgi:glucokinase|uniref:Glucokinase n=1 Tax=Jatrophihabitans lederbergiae TaxID=3075547 RepID=A0ABU2J8Q3_9ACTN|nr:ROK family glucokinase [Jatrophihabitans sp. DSM 44399]MDT0261360.1 ROK family glucokinase [Jatrophihabitans sp. DSM 44399]